MTATITVHVEQSANCDEARREFTPLGATWRGHWLTLPFGQPEHHRMCDVVGRWQQGERRGPCCVCVVKVLYTDEAGQGAAYLVYGEGNAGVRINDPEAEPDGTPLPPGYGRPWLWVQDPLDLPPHVLGVVE